MKSEHLNGLPGAFYKHPWPWVCLVYCLFLFVAEVSLVDGNIFNSYPFMFNDSFDYVFEGHALASKFQGIPTPEFPVLRNPGYVLVQSLAHLGSSPEYVLFFITNALVWLYLMTPFFLARVFRGSNRALYTAGLLFLLNPSNDLFVYVLSEAQAMSLMTLSVVCYMIHVRKGRAEYLYLAVVLALLGALTQTYAAIPLLMYMGFESLSCLLKKRIPWKPLAVIGFLGLSYGAIRYVWLAGIPHDSTPANFQLLNLSFANLRFYLDTWGYLLVLYAPLVYFVFRNFTTVKKAVVADPLIWRTLSTVLVFASLAFFYQWQDFRFTLSYLPLIFVSALLVLSSTGPPRSRVLLQVAVVQLLFFGVFVAGRSLDRRITWIKVSPQTTYAALLIRAEPLDRGNLGDMCATKKAYCKGAILRPQTQYQETIFRAMMQLHFNIDAAANSPDRN